MPNPCYRIVLFFVGWQQTNLKMTTAKKILLGELNEQTHPEKVENVIFWALEHYANSEPKGTWGRTIAYAIKERILEAEKIDADSGAVGKK